MVNKKIYSTESFGNISFFWLLRNNCLHEIKLILADVFTRPKNNEIFHCEKADIFKADLSSTVFQQIDDTGAKVNGNNHYAQILVIRSILLILLSLKRSSEYSGYAAGGKPRIYLFNEEAFTLMESFRLPCKMISKIRNAVIDTILDEKQMQQLMGRYFSIQKR